MSGEGNIELARPPAAEAAKAPVDPREQRRRVQAYVETLHHADELSELIVALEGVERGGGLDDPGVRGLVEATGVDLGSPERVRELELILGERAAALRFGALKLGATPRLERRDMEALSSGLLTVMESARMAATSPAEMPDQVGGAVREALELYQRNLPPRDATEARWWAEARGSALTRALPGYLRVAAQLDRLEADPARGLLLRSPTAMAVLLGLFGLLTFAVPVSTPFVCLALALFGYYVAHPFWVQQVVEPLRAVGDNLAAEGDRVARLAGEAPWTEEHCTVESALQDLMPILEGERRAGRGSEHELRQAIRHYFDEAEPFFEASGRGGRYLQNLRRLVEGMLARELSRYVVARQRWEGSLLARVVDTPLLSALVFAIVTLPVAFIASRISPIPPTIDFPLMVAVLAALGHALPRILPGTLPARAALLERLAQAQAALDAAP